MDFSEDEQKAILNLVRDVLKNSFDKNQKVEIPFFLEKKFSEKRGVFVTLKKNNELRGCIGFTEPVFPLGIALLRAATAAAFHDMRFQPLREEELKDIKVEATILTKPEEIKVKNRKDLLKKIKIGRDGLIAEKGKLSGLLLPQVPVEQSWNQKQFLEHTCEKAGLDRDAWLDESTKVFRFQGELIH